MLQYVIAGLVIGSIYAIAASGIVITYVSTGVLNFAFGAEAYFVARFYYFLHVQHMWSIVPAALVAVPLGGSLLGLVLWAVLFRFLRNTPQVIRIVVTIGLTVCIPPIATMLFGNEAIDTVPGLAPLPEHIFMVFGSAITLDQLIVYIAVILIVTIGALVLRFTEAGLRVRALVDSSAMTSLNGVNPIRIEVAIWVIGTFLAGVTGVLIGPIVGLDSSSFTVIIAAAFAAVVAAKLRSIWISVLVGFLMGVGGSVLQEYMPASSPFTQAIIPSIPGIFIFVFLLYQVIRRGRVDEEISTGSALDQAILPQGGALASLAIARGGSRSSRLSGVGLIVVVAILPIVLHGFWVGLIGLGAAYGIAFLSFSLVTGEGGMIWLCEITFAAVGAIATGQLNHLYHLPVLLAVVAGGVIAGLAGTVIAALTIRLGDLYVALATLTFALLAENLVYIVNRWYNSGLGLPINSPSFATSTRGFSYLAIIAFCLVALLVLTLRRSTAGLALTAMRSSTTGTICLGISVVRLKIFVAVLAAFVAGIGGGLLSLYANAAVPSNFPTVLGLTWMAVLVTTGLRSNSAALVAGLAYACIPALFLTYLSEGWQQLPPALFGLGAIMVARNPDGVLAQNARQVGMLVARFRGPRPPAGVAITVEAEPMSGVGLQHAVSGEE